MVYRGKPSAGCLNCRKAKKRCDLEQPSCTRCRKLKKPCSGYRDTTELQVQDETKTVIRKHNASHKSNLLEPPRMPTPSQPGSGVLTPATVSSDSSSDSDRTIDLPAHEADVERTFALFETQAAWGVGSINAGIGFALSIRPEADDVAMNFFYNAFTTGAGHWRFFRNPTESLKLDPCLDLAMKACGMAALDNASQGVLMGREYARSLYAEALGLINAALRDPVQCTRDASLIAVAMLGFYENLVCENRQSIQSWKAHVHGATQLLKLRGKDQFKTEIGRVLYRETQAQILIQCLWDGDKPPSFLREYQRELSNWSPDKVFAPLADALMSICLDFAYLRWNIRQNQIPDLAALEEASNIETQFIEWSINVMADSEAWRYYELEVPDSKHVWNGMVHAYTCNPAPNLWNTWRAMRIMLSRIQERLARKLQLPNPTPQQFRALRRQMADGICCTVPVALGHASPAFSSPCPLMTAYATIWPLFFAGTCTMERLTPESLEHMSNRSLKPEGVASASFAQAMWILGRFDYISNTIGLRWAESVAATLRGDFRIFDIVFTQNQNHRPSWIDKIEKSHRGPGILMEPENPLTDRLTVSGPRWIGKIPGEHDDSIMGDEVETSMQDVWSWGQ